jgi:Spy/CpxP family protein refolding chaperone
MKRSTKIITTVALTVGLVGGAAAIGKKHYGSHEKRAEYMVSYITDELELDSTQSQALDVLKDQMLSARETMKAKSMRDEAMNLLNAESFDRAAALDMVTAKTAAVNEQAPDLVNAMGDFLDSLSAEQKAEITEIMKERRGHKGRHKHRG